jgi:hypothetical protein
MKSLQLLFANGKTSIPGIIFVVCMFLTFNPGALNGLVPEDIAKKVTGWAALITGIYSFATSKANTVSGNGTIANPTKTAQPDGTQKTLLPAIIALLFIPTFLAGVLLASCANNPYATQSLTDAVAAALAYSQGNDGVSASYAIQGLSAGIRSLEGTSASGQPAAIAQQAIIAQVPELAPALTKAATQLQGATNQDAATEAIAQTVYSAAVKTR